MPSGTLGFRAWNDVEVPSVEAHILVLGDIEGKARKLIIQEPFARDLLR